ncbi:uncharacterized protein EI90DRAFT_3070075 [Cantharellus anzutake]|uniref:uncharacterized protein n=1 Tax=Cantharellus anzutake TaxID=1750568 RepID=UPI001907CDCF|nr:uncharacterized protein EI90DRAFT_3070075 [Cantharellus anzutake]KAF8326655.1 hypothetical protein EI90DRAFT_3070075 [Cantharellus anzutake]
MRFHAQRQHVVYSLDALLYQLFLLSYLIDPVLLRFIFRSSIQTQLTRPREMGRSVRFYFVCLCVLHIPVILRHPFFPFEYDSRGVLLDFVGRAFSPPFILVITTDVLIFILQVITVIIAHETGAEVDPDVPDPLAYDSSSVDVGGDENLFHKQHYREPILHLRLRPTWQSIRHPPPPRPPGLPLPGVTQRLSGASRLEQLLRTMQRRVREQTEAMAQASGNNVGAENADTPSPRTGNGLPGAMPPER